MDALEAAATGITLAKNVLLAYADDDEKAVLDLINAAPDLTSRWAVGYLAAGVLEVVKQHHQHKPVHVQRALRRLAANAENNILETQMGLMTEGEAHG